VGALPHDRRVAGRSRKSAHQLKLGELSCLRATALFDVDSFLVQDGEKRVVPTEFRVFPAGTFSTTKGDFVFSERSAESVMSWYTRRGLRLMGDYEHQTDEPAVGRPPVIAPASITRMTPVVRMNAEGKPELWVTEVKWTDLARSMLERGEYAYFSPTFGWDRETHEVLALLRIALTNDPAINELEPLVAATSAAGDDANPDEGEPTMANETCAKCAATDAHLKTLSDAHAKLVKDHETLSAANKESAEKHAALVAQHQQLAAHLKSFQDWAAEEAEEHGEGEETMTARLTAANGGQKPSPTVILAELSAQRKLSRTFVREVAALTGDKTPSAALGTLTAWKAGSVELTTLKAQAAKQEEDKRQADLVTLTSAAVKDGKLTPAMRDTYLDRAKARGTGEVLEFLTAMLSASAAPVVSRTETQPPSQETAMAMTTLSAETKDYLTKVFGPSVTLEAAAAANNRYAEYLRRNTGARTS
jgi:phage I-like protein